MLIDYCIYQIFLERFFVTSHINCFQKRTVIFSLQSYPLKMNMPADYNSIPVLHNALQLAIHPFIRVRYLCFAFEMRNHDEMNSGFSTNPNYELKQKACFKQSSLQNKTTGMF